jgi:cyclic beta-1,2-glucan synthetase
MEIDPVIPATWPRFSLAYRRGETTYAIEVENPAGCQRGVLWVEMDGKRLAGKVIPLERQLVKHRVVVMMGKSS